MYIYYKYVRIAQLFLTDPSLDWFDGNFFLTAMQPTNSMVKIMVSMVCSEDFPFN